MEDHAATSCRGSLSPAYSGRQNPAGQRSVQVRGMATRSSPPFRLVLLLGGLVGRAEAPRPARSPGAAALWPNLSHLLVDALVDLLLGCGRLVRGDGAAADPLVNARMGGVLERRGDISPGFAVRRCNVRQRFGRQLLL